MSKLGWSGLFKSNWNLKIHNNSLQLLSFTEFLLKNTYITDIFDGKTAILPKMSAHVSDIVNIKADFHLTNVNCSHTRKQVLQCMITCLCRVSVTLTFGLGENPWIVKIKELGLFSLNYKTRQMKITPLLNTHARTRTHTHMQDLSSPWMN